MEVFHLVQNQNSLNKINLLHCLKPGPLERSSLADWHHEVNELVMELFEIDLLIHLNYAITNIVYLPICWAFLFKRW